MHRDHGAPLGKLFNKYHNWKNTIRIAPEKSTEPKAKKRKAYNMPYEVTGTEQDHMRALKYENFELEEKMMHWKGCVATRLNSINKAYSTGKQQLIELWPMYKEPQRL